MTIVNNIKTIWQCKINSPTHNTFLLVRDALQLLGGAPQLLEDDSQLLEGVLQLLRDNLQLLG